MLIPNLVLVLFWDDLSVSQVISNRDRYFVISYEFDFNKMRTSCEILKPDSKSATLD